MRQTNESANLKSIYFFYVYTVETFGYLPP